MVKRKQKWVALPLTPEFQNISATSSNSLSQSTSATATTNYRGMTKDNNNNKSTVTSQSGNETSSYTTSNHYRYNNRDQQQQQQQLSMTSLSASAAPYRKYNNHYQTNYQRHQNGLGNGNGSIGMSGNSVLNQNGYNGGGNGMGNGNIASIDERKQNMFNEDEYTKITTPRQDVLLKKKLINQRRYVQNSMGGVGMGMGMGSGSIHNGLAYSNSRMIPNYNMTPHILVPPPHPQMMPSTHSLMHGQRDHHHHQQQQQQQPKGSSTTATTNGNSTTSTAASTATAAANSTNSQSNANQSVIDYMDPNMQLPPQQLPIYDNVSDSYPYYNLQYGQSGPPQHTTYYDTGKGYLYTTPAPVCVYNTYYNPSFIPNNMSSVGTAGVDQYSGAVAVSTAASGDDGGGELINGEMVSTTTSAEEESESELHTENGQVDEVAAEETSVVDSPAATKATSGAAAVACDETDCNGDAESVSSSATTETVIANKAASATTRPPFVSKSVLRLDAQEFIPQAMRNKAATAATTAASAAPSAPTSTVLSKSASTIKTIERRTATVASAAVSTTTTMTAATPITPATPEGKPEPKTAATPPPPPPSSSSSSSSVPSSQHFYEGKPIYYDKKPSYCSAAAAQTPTQQSTASNRASSNGTLPNANRRQSVTQTQTPTKPNSPKTPPTSIETSPSTNESVTAVITPKKSQPDNDEWVVAISSRKKRNLLAQQQKSFETVSVPSTPEPVPTADETEATVAGVNSSKRKSKKTPKKTAAMTAEILTTATTVTTTKKSTTNEDVTAALEQSSEDNTPPLHKSPEINNNHATKKSTKNQSKIAAAAAAAAATSTTQQVQTVKNGTTPIAKNVISAATSIGSTSSMDSNRILSPATTTTTTTSPTPTTATATATTTNHKESKKKAKRKSMGSAAATSTASSTAATTTPPTPPKSQSSLPCLTASDFDSDSKTNEELGEAIERLIKQRLENAVECRLNAIDLNGSVGSDGGSSEMTSGTPTKITAPIKVPMKNFTHSTQFGGFGQTNSILASLQSLPTCLTNKNVDISFKLNNNKSKEPQNRLSGVAALTTVSSIVTKNPENENRTKIAEAVSLSSQSTQSTNDAIVQDNDDDRTNKTNNVFPLRESSTSTKSDDVPNPSQSPTSAPSVSTYKMGDVTTGVCNWLNKRKGVKSFKSLQELRQMGVNFSKNVSNSSILVASAASTVTATTATAITSKSTEPAAAAAAAVEDAAVTTTPVDETESDQSAAAALTDAIDAAAIAALKPNTSGFLTAATNVGCTIS